ncbi:MAG: TIGR00341 family protein [Xanthomonadales bacterium]|nr:TIGR00341 family protein [Xanthomonadales bacterium]
MSLRLLQLKCTSEPEGELAELIDSQPVLSRSECTDEGCTIQLLLRAEHAERVLDELREAIEDGPVARLCLLPVAATLPLLEDDEDDVEDAQARDEESPIASGRISREELLSDIEENLGITRVFLFTSLLATFVAALGLVRDDDVVLIGAMVIAPLLGPLVALSLGTVLGDFSLIRRALITTAVGAGPSLLLACGLGLLLQVDPSLDGIAQRSQAGPVDVLLALAAGAAGVFAFTRGVSAALIGVMVAVALVPPLVAAGLQLGAGHVGPAGGALALFAINVLSVVLAGVASFALQGVRPRNWWEAKRARRAMWSAILSCVLLLAALLTVMSYLDDSDWSLPFNF